MSIHLAITASDSFINNFLTLAKEQFIGTIGKITIVESKDRDLDNYEELETLNEYDYEYKNYSEVDWKNVDLYLFNDFNVENLKFLTGAAAQSILSIDCTGYSAVLDLMPVVIPRIDEHELENVKEKSFAALPHPQVSQLIYVLDSIRKQQSLLYVSVSNILPVTYIDDYNSARELAKETRKYFNMEEEELDLHLAFDVNDLIDVAPSKQINIEGQIKRLLPQVDCVHVHNVVAPVFFGTMQQVSVGLTTGNLLDQGIINDWLDDVKNFPGITYREEKSSPRKFVEKDSEHLLELSNIAQGDNVKWTSVTDNQQLVLFQLLELLNLFIKRDVITAI